MPVTLLRGRPRYPGPIIGDVILRPNNIDSLLLWLSADVGVYKDAGVTLAVNNDTVQQWNDRSAVPYSWSQATAGNRPTFNTNIINGLPAVAFNGSATKMSNALLVSGNTISLFLVVKPSSTSPIGILDTGPNQNYTFRNYAGGQMGWIGAGTNDILINLSLANTNPVLIELLTYYNSASSGVRHLDYYRNSVLVSNNTGGITTTLAWAGPIIGVINNGLAGSWYNGYLAELILFSSYLSTASRKAVETYLNVKYALW